VSCAVAAMVNTFYIKVGWSRLSTTGLSLAGWLLTSNEDSDKQGRVILSWCLRVKIHCQMHERNQSSGGGAIRIYAPTYFPCFFCLANCAERSETQLYYLFNVHNARLVTCNHARIFPAWTARSLLSQCKTLATKQPDCCSDTLVSRGSLLRSQQDN